MYHAVLRAGFDPSNFAPRAEFSDASVYRNQPDKENAQPAARPLPPSVGPSKQYTEPSTSGKQNQNTSKRNAPPAKSNAGDKSKADKPATHPAKKSREDFPALPAASQPPTCPPVVAAAPVAPWAPAPPTDFDALFARMSTMMAQQIEQAFAAREVPAMPAASAGFAPLQPISSNVLAATIAHVETGIKDQLVISNASCSGLMPKDVFIGHVMSKDLPELTASDVFESMDEDDAAIDAEAEAETSNSAYDRPIYDDLS
jgi:hypothetical protein